MNRVVRIVMMLAMVVATVKGAVAPPPEYFSVAPSGYVVGNAVDVVQPNVVNQASEPQDAQIEDVDASGMSLVVMLGLLVFASASSAVIIYRLKVRS